MWIVSQFDCRLYDFVCAVLANALEKEAFARIFTLSGAFSPFYLHYGAVAALETPLRPLSRCDCGLCRVLNVVGVILSALSTQMPRKRGFPHVISPSCVYFLLPVNISVEVRCDFWHCVHL